MIMSRLLKQNRNGTPKVNRIELPQVNPIDAYLAGIRVIKSTEQLCNRSLTCAVLTNDCRDLPGGNHQVEILQRIIRAARVFKIDLTELYPRAQGSIHGSG